MYPVNRGPLLGLLALLCVVQPALATPAEGTLVAEGALLLPGGASADVLAAAALLHVTQESGTMVLRLEADSLRVQRYERTLTEVQAPDGSKVLLSSGTAVHNYTLTDVAVTAFGSDHLGWLGMYLPEPTPVRVAAWDSLSIAAEARPVVATTQSGADERTRVEPQFSDYEWEGVTPLLTGEGSGVIAWEGGGALKIMGPDLRFASASNETTWTTGNSTREEDPLPERVQRWFFLRFDDARLEAGGRGTFRFAAGEADVRWSGTALLRPLQGRVTAGGATYEASGGVERLTGELAATLRPVVSAGGVRVQVDLRGDLVDSSLAQTTRGPFAPGAAPGWLVPMLVVGVAVAAALGTWHRVRRTRAGRITPDDHLALAHLAAEQDRFQEAVAHVREARAQAPRSVRLLLEEASFLGAMGRVDEALAHYAKAAELDPEGDAEFQAAVLLLQSEGDAARAEPLVVVALEKNPILVLEVLYDVTGTFHPLRGRPRVEEALERARRALGET